jgi:hypothetical protein
VTEPQDKVMGYEMWRALADERIQHSAELSPRLAQMLDAGMAGHAARSSCNRHCISAAARALDTRSAGSPRAGPLRQGRPIAASRAARRQSGRGGTVGALAEGVRSRDFWLIAGAYFVCGATTNGLIGTHMIAGDGGLISSGDPCFVIRRGALGDDQGSAFPARPVEHALPTWREILSDIGKVGSGARPCEKFLP